jgi:hypothetical protein
MTDREERIAANEALFREVNERVQEVVPDPEATEADVIEFLCECGDADCTAVVSVSLGKYESVRAEPTHFLVLPGHEVPDVERVVDETDRYSVVEKHEEEAEIARKTDPRSKAP